MKTEEIFKDQNVRISPLHNKENSHHVVLISGSVSRFKDTCEYYFKDVKMMKDGGYNVTWSCMCYDDQDIDCTGVIAEDAPALIVDNYMELSENGDNCGLFIGEFNFDDVYNDCDCYEDGWQLEYFKDKFYGTMTRYKDADYNKQYTFDLDADAVRVYNIKDGKIHVEIYIEVS